MTSARIAREAPAAEEAPGADLALLHQHPTADRERRLRLEFEKRNRKLKVRVDGQVTVNGIDESIAAALAGFGIAFALEDAVIGHIRDGSLVRILEDWTPPFSGYHLYYPSRRQASPAFSLVVDALRYQAEYRSRQVT
jgi:DNA-binding transcriptional LysR family regulator